jgi:hypothetical protein
LKKLPIVRIVKLIMPRSEKTKTMIGKKIYFMCKIAPPDYIMCKTLGIKKTIHTRQEYNKCKKVGKKNDLFRQCA